MKNILTILLIAFQFSAFGQKDTLTNLQENIRIIQVPDCAHGHICCQVGCYCCPGSIRTQQISQDIRTAYPQNDSLTYNQYLGENIAGFHLANGWREDTINGGLNKGIYNNSYIESTEFDKRLTNHRTAFKYENGKLYTGRIEDTILVSFTPDKIRGYLSGQPYYESKELKLILRGDCVNGLLQGRGVLAAQLVGFGIYSNLKLSECSFEDGEIVGTIKNWDLNSVEFEIRSSKIYSREDTKDYFEFIKLLDLTEVNYVKGSPIWSERTIHERNEKTGRTKVRTVKNKK